ncbi:MAG: acetylglutamate kinase [Bdellovibrionales bacterium]|nr:acetylglutamate kinase [Bdellovibrionales bacterium]
MEVDASKKAKILLEALPYIRNFSGCTFVIKFGGSILNDTEAKQRFCSDVVLLRYVGINVVIVHGGGKEIQAWQERLGLKTEFIDGLRVTTPETMEITEMVLSGKVNRDIVASMNRVGGNAIGFSGKDAHLFLAHKRPVTDKGDLGLVGEIHEVNTAVLETLLAKSYVPVISSVAVSPTGETLNINADEAATAIACALKARKLILLTDVDGILKDGKLLSLLDLAEAESLMQDASISGGMIPKLGGCIKAIKSNVHSVHIVKGTAEHAVLLEIFTDQGIGTKITHT